MNKWRGFRGKCPFRQYIPSKPDKYGMKIFWACDSATAYPLGAIPYMGKEGKMRAEIGLGSRIVKQLCHPYFNSNRIMYDTYFISFELAQNLFQNGLTMLKLCARTKDMLAVSAKQES